MKRFDTEPLSKPARRECPRNRYARPHSKRMPLLVLLCLALVATPVPLAGCKESDSIVEWVLDQSSPNVDRSNPEKFYIPDESSKTTIKDLDLDKDEVEKQDKIKRDLPSKTGSHDRKKVKSRSLEGSEDNGSAPRQKPSGAKKGSHVAGDADDKGKSKKESGSGGAKRAGKGHGSEKGTDAGHYQVNMGDDSYLERTYDASNGNTEDLPDDVSTIVASGKLATAVLMLGKEGTLRGSSRDYLGRPGVKKVFAGKLKKAKPLWADDDGALSNADVDAIIDRKPSAVLVVSGQISSRQERAIGQNVAGCRVVTLPGFASDGSIRTTMKAIGKMLSTSTGGASAKAASAYLDFIDEEVLSPAEDAHGGGLVTYNAVDYSSTDASNVATVANPSSKQLWTLYISDWDADATVTATYDGSTLFKDRGAAYTNIGWQWSPLSYYMSVGGIINNAAAYGPLSTASQQPVLQFNENQVSYRWQNFAIKTDEKRGGGSFSRYRSFYVLTNAREAAQIGGGLSPSNTHPLGSDDFNTVIVANEDIASALKKARKKKNGLYTMYGYVKTSSGSGYGRKASGKRGTNVVYTTVKGDAGYDIYVNPCGYVESWADGSVESPLESLWIANKYWGLSKDKLADAVQKFYRQFYGYDGVKVSKVLSGSYAR